jgi:epsilon-lactone hydrolase
MTGRISPRWKRWVSLNAYGLFTSTLFRASTPPQTLRARFERFGSVNREAIRRKHPQVSFDDHRAGPVMIESARASHSPSCTVLHLHAALEDVLLAYQHLRSMRPGVPTFVTGDSAGGGLVLSLLVRVRELGEARAAGAILLSPWTDLSASGASVDGNRHADRWLTCAHLSQWGRYYAGDADPRTPLLSPLFADLSGLPPLFLLVGEDEILLDDAVRVAERATRAGTDARLLVGKGMQHDWPLTLPWLDESREAWKAMQAFVQERRAGR